MMYQTAFTKYWNHVLKPLTAATPGQDLQRSALQIVVQRVAQFEFQDRFTRLCKSKTSSAFYAEAEM